MLRVRVGAVTASLGACSVPEPWHGKPSCNSEPEHPLTQPLPLPLEPRSVPRLGDKVLFGHSLALLSSAVFSSIIDSVITTPALKAKLQKSQQPQGCSRKGRYGQREMQQKFLGVK